MCYGTKVNYSRTGNNLTQNIEQTLTVTSSGLFICCRCVCLHTAVDLSFLSSAQVKDPNSYRFAVWKTQGPGAGTEITGQLASTGSTYTDPTGRLTMTRTSGSTIVASLSAGMSLTMTTYTSFLNFQALVSGPRSAMTGIVSQKPWAANNCECLCDLMCLVCIPILNSSQC